VTVSGNTATDAAISSNVTNNDPVPYNWQSAEYWKINLAQPGQVTINYTSTTPPNTPLMQLMGPGVTDSNVSGANGLDFNGAADGTNEDESGIYRWDLPQSGTYIIALGLGNVNGQNGGYRFSISVQTSS